ncbi:MAG: hypothetical protein EOO36_08955 [Cytophagaceae bacterium]|nr:MAG: hypothetical protein EOO36_08955 [Cytophagaceae bacterium]
MRHGLVGPVDALPQDGAAPGGGSPVRWSVMRPAKDPAQAAAQAAFAPATTCRPPASSRASTTSIRKAAWLPRDIRSCKKIKGLRGPVGSWCGCGQLACGEELPRL